MLSSKVFLQLKRLFECDLYKIYHKLLNNSCKCNEKIMEIPWSASVGTLIT